MWLKGKFVCVCVCVCVCGCVLPLALFQVEFSGACLAHITSILMVSRTRNPKPETLNPGFHCRRFFTPVQENRCPRLNSRVHDVGKYFLSQNESILVRESTCHHWTLCWHTPRIPFVTQMIADSLSTRISLIVDMNLIAVSYQCLGSLTAPFSRDSYLYPFPAGFMFSVIFVYYLQQRSRARSTLACAVVCALSKFIVQMNTSKIN